MLQGSLDNFALDEVLGLLASTSKTGLLEITGDRGSGSLQLSQGRLVDAEASSAAHDAPPEDVVFELLRFGAGSFSFVVSDIEPISDASDIDDVLEIAENRLAEWRAIEAVVPSVEHHVAPVPELPADEVNVSRDEWAVLIAVGTGHVVVGVCDQLGGGEVRASGRIKSLVERGLLIIGPPESSRSLVAPPPARRHDVFAEPAPAIDSAPALEARPPLFAGSYAPMPTVGVDSGLDDDGSSLDSPVDHSLDSALDPNVDDEPDEEIEPAAEVDSTAPGGLLMRYLTGDR